MKITKFAQSCVLIETKNKRILIDPGYLEFDKSLLKEAWANIDILLVTHHHSDHCYTDAIKEIIKNPKTKFYTTKEVVSRYPKLSPHIVKEGSVLKINGLKIEVVKAVHGYVPLMKGRAVYENVGYIIDDGSNRAYQTSDTICFENDYKCDIIFVPICNHAVVMGPWAAALFAKDTGAKLVIPIHYHSPKHPTDTKAAKKEFDKQGLNYKFLKIGESITF